MLVNWKLFVQRLGWVFLLILLAGCAFVPPDLPAPTPVISVFTPAPPLALPTPAPASQADIAVVLGIEPGTPIDDQVIYARADGSVIFHDLASGSERELLGAGRYVLDPKADEGYFLTPLLYPPAISPDGRWLLLSTQTGGSWLAAMDGSEQRQIDEHPLAATWAPDSLRIAYTNFANQPQPPNPDAIFVRNVVENDMPRILAELSSRAMYAFWSPGCADGHASGSSCGRHIASITCSGSDAPICTVWLADVNSGEAQPICRFTARSLESTPQGFAWATDGFLFWTLEGRRACTILGDVMPLSRAFDLHWNVPSPDGVLWVNYAPLAGREGALTLRNAETGAGVFFSDFSSMPRPHWTADSRHLVVVSGDAPKQDVVLLDAASGELTPIARDVTFLGVFSQLRQRGVLPANMSGAHRGLPEAGPATDWPRYHLPELGLTVQAPAGWRVQQVGRGRYVIANFAFDQTVGVIPLLSDNFEVVISRTYGRGAPITDADNWLHIQKETQSWGRVVEEVTLAGQPAVLVIDAAYLLSESYRTFHGNYEIIIERAPLNSAYDAIFRQILNSIQWDVN